MQSHFNIMTPAIKDALNQGLPSWLINENNQIVSSASENNLPDLANANGDLRATVERDMVVSDPDFRY